MKFICLALCVTTIAALVIGTCGCTESLNSSENATQPAEQTLAANNLADAINKKYEDHAYTVVDPFLKGETPQLIVYSGAVRSSDYTYHVTITLTNYAVAPQDFNSKVSDAQALGFEERSSGNDSYGSYWVGYLNGLYKDPNTPRMRIDLYYPLNVGLILPSASDSNPFYVTNADVSQYYQVTTNEQEINPS